MIYKKIVKTRYTHLKARYFETDLNVVKYFSIETSHIGCRLRKIRTHLKTLKRQAVFNIQTDPHSALNDCKQTVSGSISLGSPPFFSPFPHGTCTLSVQQQYLGLDRGRPGFRQNITCSALLRILLSKTKLSYTGVSPSVPNLSRLFYQLSLVYIAVLQPHQ